MQLPVFLQITGKRFKMRKQNVIVVAVIVIMIICITMSENSNCSHGFSDLGMWMSVLCSVKVNSISLSAVNVSAAENEVSSEEVLVTTEEDQGNDIDIIKIVLLEAIAVLLCCIIVGRTVISMFRR